MENTSENEKQAKIARVREALGSRFSKIDDFKETNIKKGVGITSLFKLKPVGEVYSKCYNHRLYENILQGYVITDNGDPSVSDKYDSQKILWKYEGDIIKNLNQISSELKNVPYKDEKQLAPEFYGDMPEEERFFMEYIKSPSYKHVFIDIDKKILASNDSNEIENLNLQKSWHKGVGLYHIAKFHYLCNENKKLFGDIRKRRKTEEVARQKEYLENMLLDSNKNEKMIRDDILKCLKKEKEIDIYQIINNSLNLKKEYSKELKLIHGDFGTHHLTLGGVCYDFDEFRLDLPQDDIVRFLNNEFASPVTEHQKKLEEKYISKYLANYFIDIKRFEGIIPWNDKFKHSAEALISDNHLVDEFLAFRSVYYLERLEENIHIYAINKSAGEQKLKMLAEGHPKLNNVEDFQKYRTDDIARSLSFLLGTRYGREKILRDPKRGKPTTQYLESLRSALERGGVIEEDIFKEDEGGMLEL